MSADWLKMSTSLDRNPKVHRICDLLNASTTEVIGLLYLFWAQADTYTDDGFIKGQTKSSIDRYLHKPGAAAAFEDVGWLKEVEGGVLLPNYAEHNGETTKRRILKHQEQKRRRIQKRTEASDEDKVKPIPASNEDAENSNEAKFAPQEQVQVPEQSSSSKKNNALLDQQAEELRLLYPRIVGKTPALREIKKALTKKSFEQLKEAVTAYAAAVMGADPQFIPHCATWMSQGRYDDDRADWKHTGKGSGKANGYTKSLCRVEDDEWTKQFEASLSGGDAPSVTN